MLVAVTLAVYARTATFDFINFDDQGYVYQNPHIAAGLSVATVR